MPEPWPFWVDNVNIADTGYQTTQVATAGTNVAAWPTWIGPTVQTIAASNAIVPDVWVNWQQSSLAIPTSVQLTPEQQRSVLIRRNRTRAHELRQNVAARKARELLLSQLSASQREEYLAERAFHVETADGRRRYRIAHGLASNVILVKCDGQPPVRRTRSGGFVREGARFCMHVYHPDGPVPYEDNLLSQKLLIEANERRFLQLANVG